MLTEFYRAIMASDGHNELMTIGISVLRHMIYTHQKSLATLDDNIVDREIAAKLEMRIVLKVEEVQT